MGGASNLTHSVRIEAIRNQQLAMLKIIHESFEKAERYSTVVVAGGYVGFFTAWSGISDDMALFERAWSLMCIICSLSTFVFWELFKMIKTGFLQKYQLEVCECPPNEFDEKFKVLLKKEAAFKAININVWPNILIVSIFFAILAIAFFLKGCFAALFNSGVFL